MSSPSSSRFAPINMWMSSRPEPKDGFVRLPPGRLSQVVEVVFLDRSGCVIMKVKKGNKPKQIQAQLVDIDEIINLPGCYQLISKFPLTLARAVRSHKILDEVELFTMDPDGSGREIIFNRQFIINNLAIATTKLFVADEEPLQVVFDKITTINHI